MTLGFLPNMGLPELSIILFLALVIFGPGKLPSVGKAVGQSIKEFKGSMSQEEKPDKNNLPEK